MKIKRPLLILAGGFVLGEVLGLQNDVALHVVSSGMLTVMMAAGLWFVFVRPNVFRRQDGAASSDSRTKKEYQKGRSLWIWLLPFFLCAGFWRAADARLDCERELALGLDGQKFAVTGTVEKRTLKENGTLVLVLGDCVAEEKNLKRLQVYLDKEVDSDTASRCRIGSQICVFGTVNALNPARNPGEFDSRKYYRSQKINYRMFADAYEIVDVHYWKIRESLALFREWAGNILEQIADPDDYGIYLIKICHFLAYARKLHLYHRFELRALLIQ